MKYTIVIGADCVAILINGSLNFGCSKDHQAGRFVEQMKLLESMGYSLDKIEYKSDYFIYD